LCTREKGRNSGGVIPPAKPESGGRQRSPSQHKRSWLRPALSPALLVALAMLIACSAGTTGVGSNTTCGTVLTPGAGPCPVGSLLNAAYGCTGNVCPETQICGSDSQKIACAQSPLPCGLVVLATDYNVVSGVSYCVHDSDCPPTTACSVGMCFGQWCPNGGLCSAASFGATCMANPDAGETDASDAGESTDSTASDGD
jgi:hypothetical protein